MKPFMTPYLCICATLVGAALAQPAADVASSGIRSMGQLTPRDPQAATTRPELTKRVYIDEGEKKIDRLCEEHDNCQERKQRDKEYNQQGLQDAKAQLQRSKDLSPE